MKKLLGILLVLSLLASPVFAGRTEDKTEPITNFHVFKWISNYAPNEVAVLTVNAGERGYAVISATTEEKYSEGLAIAKNALKVSTLALWLVIVQILFAVPPLIETVQKLLPASQSQPPAKSQPRSNIGALVAEWP